MPHPERNLMHGYSECIRSHFLVHAANFFIFFSRFLCFYLSLMFVDQVSHNKSNNCSENSNITVNKLSQTAMDLSDGSEVTMEMRRQL